MFEGNKLLVLEPKENAIERFSVKEGDLPDYAVYAQHIYVTRDLCVHYELSMS